MSDMLETPHPSPVPDPAQPLGDLSAILGEADHARAAGEQPRAHALYERALLVDCNSSSAWAGRAATAATLDEALVSWGSAYALEPENMEALFALDSHLQAKIETSSPDDVLSLITLAKSLADVGQKEGAYRLLVKATDLDPENEEAWVWRAGVTDDIGDALLSLNQVLALNPDNAQAQAGLHWARARVGKPEKEATPDLAPADKLVADGIALIADDKRRAHDLFVQATELDPKNENAWLWRGSTTHDLDEANTCIDQALTVNPNNEAAQEARTWVRERRLGDAVKPSSPPTAFPSAQGASELPSPSAHPDRMALLLAVLLGLLVLAIAAFLLMRLVTAR